MISKISTFAKYIDQPLIVKRFSQSVPGILISGAAAFGIYDTYQAPEKKRKKVAIKNFFVLSATVLASLISIRGLKIVLLQ